MKTRILALLCVVALFSASPVFAAPAPKMLGKFGDWGAFVHTEGKAKVCYVAAKPAKQANAPAKRGEPYLMVTHRPDAKQINVVSVFSGYAYKKDSSVEAIVDGKLHRLFTSADSAWAPDAADDKALVAALMRGRDIAVKGTPVKGEPTTDTFSLTGFTKAYQEASKACGVEGLR